MNKTLIFDISKNVSVSEFYINAYGISLGVRIFNTDGYIDVDGPGYEYKRKFIEAIDPDYVCVIGNTEIYKSLTDLSGNTVLQVTAPDIPLRSQAMR